MEPAAISSLSRDHVTLGELLGALSHALDLTEGQPEGHCQRCAFLGLRMAEALGLDPGESADLYYTILMKDLGCSSNAARICQLYLTDDLAFKRAFKPLDGTARQSLGFLMKNTAPDLPILGRVRQITRVIGNAGEIVEELMQTRCERGADIARAMRFSPQVAEGIRALDEHWDGGGRPYGLRGTQIHLYARVALMTQVADVYAEEFGLAAAADELERRSGAWFDPELVPILGAILRDPQTAEWMRAGAMEAQVLEHPSGRMSVPVDEGYLDEIARAFAMVIDAKSPFTHGHSERVARYTGVICGALGYDGARQRWMMRAALLHDIGKLGISNAILDKPGRLTEAEFAEVRRHPVIGREILGRIGAFAELAVVASAHHERLDGKGYPEGWDAERLTRDMRVIAVADVYDALTAERPYRGAMPQDKAFEIMEEMRGPALDPDCLDALRGALKRS